MSEEGQVVIPKDVRDRLRLEPGDRLEVVERPDGVLLRRPGRRSGEAFDAVTARIQSPIGYAGPTLSIDDMTAAIADIWAEGGPRRGR